MDVVGFFTVFVPIYIDILNFTRLDKYTLCEPRGLATDQRYITPLVCYRPALQLQSGLQNVPL